MKTQLLIGTISVSTITIFSSLVTSDTASAQAISFFCGRTSDGSPATMAQTPRGNVPVIRWVSNYFNQSGYHPQARCEMVSQRFQSYFQTGTLNYITTGRINGQPVVCVARSEGGGCATELPYNGLLFTLKPTSNPARTLQNLMQVRQSAGSPLDENASTSVSTEVDELTYINIDRYLTTAPVDSSSEQSNSQPNNLF